MLDGIFIALAGIVAVIVVGFLIILDKNKKETEKVESLLSKGILKNSGDPKAVSFRLYLALKSYLLIFCLFVLLGAVFYFSS